MQACAFAVAAAAAAVTAAAAAAAAAVVAAAAGIAWQLAAQSCCAHTDAAVLMHMFCTMAYLVLAHGLSRPQFKAHAAAPMARRGGR